MPDAIPGLSPGNVQYNANQANQAGMNIYNNNAGWNESQFNQMYNPYVNNVVNANTEQSWRNFNQQQMPSLTSSFGATGQFGSGRAMQAQEQAARDNAQQTNWQNAQLMNQGYQSSMQNYLQQQQNAQNAAAGLVNAGTAGWNQAQGQYLLPWQMAGLSTAAISGLRPESATTSGGISGGGFLFS